MPAKILPLAFSLLAFSVSGDASTEPGASLEPTINGSVSASGLFPTQEIEDEFEAYLRWTKENGLSRLVAFESIVEGESNSSDRRFPTRSMEEQFRAYIRWVDATRISPFYAFGAHDFD